MPGSIYDPHLKKKYRCISDKNLKDLAKIKSHILQKLYVNFLRRRARCPTHSGTWFTLDKETNAVVFNYKPLRHARTYHFAQAKHRAFGGGFGDGKTLALCLECLTLLLAYPRNFGLLGRATYPELRDTTQKTFLEVCPPELIKSFNKNENVLTLYNDSVLVFRQLTALSEQDKGKFKSQNFGFIAVDQAEEIDEAVYDLLVGRLRLGIVGRRCAMVAFNMEGHNWIWERWLRDTKRGKRSGSEYFMVVAKSVENPYLPEDYVLSLLSDFPEEWVMRYVIGSFDVFKGQIFKEFDLEKHTVEDFNIPLDWTRYRTIDPGFQNPTGVLWVAVDPGDNIYFYAESYESGLTVPAQAEIIKTRDKEMIQNNDGTQTWHNVEFEWTTIDPAANRTDPVSGTTLKDEYGACGIYTIDGNNNVNAGIEKIAQRFRAVHPRPTVRIFRSCAHFISEIQNYKWAPQTRSLTQKEKPSKVNDHLVDPARYLIMSEPRYRDIKQEIIEADYEENLSHVDRFTGYGG